MTRVSHTHFGVNLLYNQQDEHGQDLVYNGSLTELVQVYKSFGFRYLRWPGGSVTENDACEDPKQFFTPRVKINFDEALSVCASEGLKLHVVIPTRVWLNSNDGLARWMNALRDCDHSLLATIELGNEYWGKDRTTGVRLHPDEYGQIVRKLLPKLQSAVPDVPIFIQNAPHWTRENSQDIYGQLVPSHTAYLAGATDHWYPQTWAGIKSPGNQFNAMRERPARANVRQPWETNVSEWNISLDNNKDGIAGLDLGLAMAQMFWRMVHEGVEWATVWGFHYRILHNKLQGYRVSGAVYTTAAGTVFKTFQNLIGFETVNSPTWAGEKSATFRKGDVYVTYFKCALQPTDIDVLQSFEFLPSDDTRTPNVDERQEGPQQQATLVPAEGFKPDKFYMVTYEKVAPMPAKRSFFQKMLDSIRGLFG